MKERVQNLIDAFLKYLVAIRGYSDATAATYEVALRQMLEKSRIYEEDHILTIDLTPYRITIAGKKRHTIAARLTAIHSFANYLENQQDQQVRLIAAEAIKVTKNLPKPIDEKYIREVLQSASLEEELLLTMLYGLGLRISELSNVQLDHIKGAWIEVRGKGNKVRELPLIEPLQELLERYLKTLSPKYYLFEKDNAPLNTAQLRYKLEKLFKVHGIKATPHQLRHSFASHLLNNGARIADISELLGHASMATTQVYTKLGTTKKMSEYMKAHPLAQHSGDKKDL